MSDSDSYAIHLNFTEPPITAGCYVGWQSHEGRPLRQWSPRVGSVSMSSTQASPSSPNPRQRDIMAVKSILNNPPTDREDEHRMAPRGRRSTRLPFRARGGRALSGSSYESSAQRRRSTDGLPPYMPSTLPDRRDARPTYDLEEGAFIWYQKDDLDLDWDTVTELYERQRFRNRRDKAGLQCKYYRFRESHKAPTVRDVRASPRPRQDPVHYGIIYLTNIRYP